VAVGYSAAVPLPDEVAEITGGFLAAIDERAPRLVQGLYLHGSLGFGGEYFPGRSDVDFVAVLAARPGPAELAALAAAHAQARASCPRPDFDGIHLLRGDLARSPDECPDLPYAYEGRFCPAGRFEVNPVTWHELARHGITVRGPRPAPGEVWTDDRALREFSRANLRTYWTERARELAARPQAAARPEVTAWCVLGVSRLHHLLAAGAMTSKSGAGRHALTAFGPRWHPVIHEALRARERPEAPSAYAADPARRARDTTEFTAMTVEAGLALPG
jgi:hypothetical protein